MSSIAASGDTAPWAEAVSGSRMMTRIWSALVMIPAVLLAVWFGTPWTELLVAIATLLMAVEWRAVCAAGGFGAAGAVLVGAVGLVTFLAAVGHVPAALVAIAVGAGLALLLAREEAGAGWTTLAPLALGLPAIALVWLRQQPEGLGLMLWLLVVVTATDTAAYFAGRAIGGPKLAPAISPNKTWAGLIGGMIAAALGSLAVGVWAGWSNSGLLLLLGALGAVVAQAGDLTESKLKRRFGVKDAGSLIPGHGGMLDRADGYIVAAPAFALLVAATARDGALPWA